MNNEIKEIFEKIKINSNHSNDTSHYNRLNLKECNLLLNYITNLQEENNLLKAKIKCMEEIKEHNQKQPKDESEIYNEMFR